MNNIWLKRFGAVTGAIYILIGLLRGGGDDGPGFLSVALKIASYPAIVIAYVWAKDGVDPKVIGMLWDMADASMVLTLAADGLLVAAVAAVAIPTRALPRWLGWGAVATALALFANVALARGQSFLPAILLFMLWILVTSIVLIRQAGAAAAPAATPPMREPALAR